MRTWRLAAALFSGILFGLGLALGGMLDPAVIRGFLDFTGAFDPRLGFVFAGAVIVSAAGYVCSRKLARPALAETFAVPETRSIDASLIVGSALFGVGWGMVGLCPGPALAGLFLDPSVFLFSIAMIAGMAGDFAIGRDRD